MIEEQRALVADLIANERELARRSASERKRAIESRMAAEGHSRSNATVLAVLRSDLEAVATVGDRFITAWAEEIAAGRAPQTPDSWDLILQDLKDLLEIELSWARNHQHRSIEAAGLSPGLLDHEIQLERSSRKNYWERQLRVLRRRAELKATAENADWLAQAPVPEATERAQLTGELFDNSALDRDLSNASSSAVLAGSPLSLLFLDVDGFKGINDTPGHSEGDVLLKSVASCLRRATGMRGRSYRKGGDEFCAILPNSSETEAAALAERVRACVEGLGREITASIGIATSSSQEESAPEELLKRADDAMYSSKTAGGNRVSVSQSRGGAKREESAPELAARLATEAREAKERVVFLHSQAGTQAAAEEAEKVGSELATLTEGVAVASGTHHSFWRRPRESGRSVFVVGSPVRTMSVEHITRSSRSFLGSELKVTVWKEHDPFQNWGRISSPISIASETVRFDVSADGERGWREGDRFLTSRQVADRALKLLVLHSRESAEE